MALDFPTNPQANDTYLNYVFDGTVWRIVNTSSTAAITTSDVKPETANDGDMWYDTTTGNTYIYVEDEDSSQWVQQISTYNGTSVDVSIYDLQNEVQPVNRGGTGATSAAQARENIDVLSSSEVQALLDLLLPSGTISQTAVSTAPTGWLLCQGQAVSRTTYDTLFTAIGTTYGSGDGSTTFNIPDLQGRVAVGKNGGTFATLGSTGGAETHTLSVTEMPSHTHTQDAHNHNQDAHNHTQDSHRHWISSADRDDANMTGTGANSQNYGLFADAGSYQNYDLGRTTGRYGGYTTATNQATTATNQATTATNQNTGGGGAHNNLQPYIVLNYMIKV